MTVSSNFFSSWILLWFLSSLSFRIPSPSLLNYSLQTIKIYQLELTDTFSKWRVKCWFIKKKKIFTSLPFTHSQHLPSLLRVAAEFTSPCSPMTADAVRCQCNALVKKTNATLGRTQEGISKCKEVTPQGTCISSSEIVWIMMLLRFKNKKFGQVQRKTTETGGMRGESKTKREIYCSQWKV